MKAELVAAINEGHENPLYLKGVTLDRKVRATNDAAGLADADAWLVVTPAQHMRASLAGFAAHLRPGTPVALCSKGIERGTLKLMSDVLAETLPDAVPAVLSGPSFAADVARGLPTAVTLACTDAGAGEKLIAMIGSASFRPYLADDLVGAEIGGSVKKCSGYCGRDCRRA